MKRYLLFIMLFVVENAMAFSYFKTVDGKRYFGDIKEETASFFMVEIENEDIIIKLNKDDLILVEREEEGLEIFKPEYIKKIDADTAVSPFYAKGNAIYIPMSSNKIVKRTGAGTLKMLMVNDAYWNIVDTEDEAHYIMKYVFDDRGPDKAYLLVTDKQGRNVYMSKKVSATDLVPWHAGEESATKLYKGMMKSIKKGKPLVNYL